MTGIMSTADLKSLLEKRCRNKIEQNDKIEREELLREIRELENQISESNSSASSVSTSSVSASSVSASSVYASSNTDEIVGISSESQPLVPGQTNSTKLRKMTPEEAQEERLRLAVNTVNFLVSFGQRGNRFLLGGSSHTSAISCNRRQLAWNVHSQYSNALYRATIIFNG